MTAHMMSIARHTEIADHTAACSRDLGYMVKPAVADVRVQRMNSIERIGDYDRTEDGLIRNRAGMVGGERMTAQVQSHGGELVVTFYQADRNHTRRCLVDAQGTYSADFGGRAVEFAPNDKYFAPLNLLWMARAN